MNKDKIALIGISLASFLGCLDFTIVNTALPNIQMDLKTSIVQLQWIITAFMLALSALMVIMGKLADNYGRRRMLFIGMVIFAVASLDAGFSYHINSLIFFRFLQGVGVAILYTVPIAIIPTLFSENQQGQATGILIGVNGFGLAIGPIIGGFIISLLNWRWIFFINIPLILISILLCFRSVPESKNSNQNSKLDWRGMILLLISLPSIIYAIVQSSVWGWESPLILSLLLIGIIGLTLFYLVEKRVKDPIIQFNLFLNRIFLTGIVANFFLAFFYTVAFFLMPLYLHNVLLLPPYKIGLALLPATMMVALLSPWVGRYVDKKGPKNLLLLGFALFAISAFMQTSFSQQTSLIYILTAFILFGIGWACILSPSIVASLSSIPQHLGGVGMGTIGTLHNFGGAIGLAIGTVVYHTQAKSMLISDLTKLNKQWRNWAEQAIADPDNAINIIRQHTSFDLLRANDIFQSFFIKGYTSAMWLLFAVSSVVILIVAVSLHRKSPQTNV